MTKNPPRYSGVVCSKIRTISVFAILLLACLMTPVSAQLPETFQVTVDKGGGEMVELNLHKYSVRSPDCRIVSWDSTNGYVEEHTPVNPGLPARTYRGFVTENPNELVLAVVHSNNTLQAEVHNGSARLWVISGVDVTTELGNGGSTPPTPAPAPAAGSGTTVVAGLPGQYLPPIGLYTAHGVEDVPSQFYDRNGQSLEQTLVWIEHQWNIFDFFNTRDTKLNMQLTEVIIRKEQFYFPEAGSGQFTTMLRNEWATQGQNKRGFVHSWFPYNFTYAGGYASGNEFYGANHSISVNALYHEVAHNWRAQHYYYGRETMTGSYPSHGEMNTQRVLYTRQLQIDQDDGIELTTSYPTNLHPRAYTDVASTLVDTAVDISPLENDYDANGDVISLKTFAATTAKGGTVTEVGGVLTYTPATGYVGKDVIIYEVQDAAGLYTEGLVHIEVINRGLAAHWTMDDASGTSATDSSGNGHAGTLVNADFSTASILGPIGNALSLGSSGYVIGDDSNLMTGTGDWYPIEPHASNFFDPMDESFTAATWIKFDSGTTSSTVLHKINAANLGYKVTASLTSGFAATLRTWDGFSGHYSVSSGAALSSNTWYHVAMVINRTDETLRLYVNGVEVGTPASLPSGFFIFNGREDLKIGGAGTAVDDARIYTKALSLAEIEGLHAAGDVPAGAPNPKDRALNVSLAPTLSWGAGMPTYEHDVYFGTDEAAVAAATTASPEYQGRQAGATFVPGALSGSSDYFWRIDEVDGATIIAGEVWKFSTAANSLISGLVLHLTMDDNDVQIANGVTHTYDDIALPAADFIAEGAVAGAAGVIGQAVNLTATNDSLQSYAPSPVAKPVSGGLTASFWINTTSTQWGGEKVYDMGGAVFLLYYNGDLRPVFDGGSSGSVTFDTNINDGQWHHVVTQNDGAGTTTLWLDGVMVGTQSESLYDLASLGRLMSIGASYGSTGENLEASYDDFAVWQRALSPSEIALIRSEGLLGRSFNAEPVLIDTSFEEADGFTGYAVGTHSSLGTVVDSRGVTWTEVTDAKIWNRTDIPPDGVQALAFGLGATLSQCDASIPGTTHGLGTVSFDYASFSGGTDVTFKLLYNAGSGWIEAWSTQMVGMNPGYSEKPWGNVEVALNIPGDVDLRWEMTGASGGKIDNVRVTGLVANTAPAFASNPINGLGVSESQAYASTLAGVATDDNPLDVLVYSKVSGPTWLNVASDGALSGTPGLGDAGVNVFTVQVVDGNGGSDTATLNITVNPTPPALWSDDFERTAGTALGGNWVEVLNDSRIYDIGGGSNLMLISVNASEPIGAVNQLIDTYVAGDRYELKWNASRATAANGTLVYEAAFGTWDGSTFTPLAGDTGSIANLNSQGKVAGPSLYYVASAAEAGQQIAVRLDVLAGSADWAGFDDIEVVGHGANTAPSFVISPIDQGDAAMGGAYSGSIAAYAGDPDASDSIAFSKESGPAWLSVAVDGSLSGTPGNGDIGANVFTVRVTDEGGLTADATLNVAVLDVNDSPIANNASRSLAEDAVIGSPVATVSASDIDTGDSLSYAIVAGNIDDAFTIDASGNVTTAAALDYETNSSYALIVKVSDNGTPVLSDTATVSVGVTDVNDAPTATDGAGSVAENTPGGAAVLTVKSSDPDAGDSVTYAITAGNTGNAFAIDATSGIVTTTMALDADTTPNYTLTVTVTDGSGLTGTAAVNISVTNVNEAPVATGGAVNIAENVGVGASVLTVGVSDPDTGDSANFAITSGNTGNAFAIDTSGNITTATALDFETTPSYTLTVSVTDGGGLSDSAAVTVTVTDSNELPVFTTDPINKPNADDTLNYSDTLGGSATDVDAGDVLTYSKLSGPAWLSVAADGALSGAPGASDAGANVFTVQVDDGNGGTASATLNITVDVASVAIFNDDFERAAGSTIGNGWIEQTNDSRIYDTSNTATKMMISVSAGVPYAIVNQLSNTFVAGERYELEWSGSRAAHANGTLVYDVSIGTWDGATFTPIASQSGSMADVNITGKQAGPAVYATASAVEAGQQIAIRFETVDGSSEWAGFDDIIVRSLGANVAPVANNGSGSVAENVAVGAAVVTATATDIDAGDTITYAITAGNTGGAFAIDSNSGAITTVTALDYETTPSYALTVTATDGGGLADAASVTVTITNVVTGDDSDNDGLNDDWEVATIGNLGTSATGDSDGDGYTAFEEMVFGMDPVGSASESAPQQGRVVDVEGTDMMEFKFRRPQNYETLNVVYQLQTNSSLVGGNWTNVTATSTVSSDGNNEWVTYLLPLDQVRAFYRCEVTPN